jgi:riboflavin synthase
MFTGLVEEIGRVVALRPFQGGARVTIAAAMAPEVGPGDSVAVSGVCLTAERVDPSAGTFTAAAVAETLRRTTAGSWRAGTRVHLERALRAGDRLGGHFVQGHVDAVANVVWAGREGGEHVLAIAIPGALRGYVVAKSSLAIDGVSLTVGALRGGLCRLYIIPETLARTLVGGYRAGTRVNIEVDPVAKYVESLLGRGHGVARGRKAT